MVPDLTMLADLFHFRAPRASGDYERAFVEEVKVTRPVPRDPKLEKLIFICWALIALKHVLVIWAVHHYHVPFHQLWVNAPTWAAGVAATLAYYWRD
jgi:hypothetical protein